MTRTHTLVAGAVLTVAAVVGAAVMLLLGPSEKHVTALFSQVVGLYPGDQVRLLGVPVGVITAIEQAPRGVRVQFTLDPDAPVPADAKALLMAPTLVTERFVQLTPARLAGPRLLDGAVIGLDRTAVPLEFDQLKRQLDDLTKALGPTGANADGALGRVVSAAAKNLRGNGTTINQTISQLATALGALSDGREDLVGTVSNLQTLASALRNSDDQVRGFTTELSQLSGTLAESSGDLGKALDVLDSSARRIGGFVHEHRDRLGTDVNDLAKVADNLAANRQALADLLQIAPTAVSNFQNVYDPFSGAIVGALAGTQFQDVNSLACALLFAKGGGFDGCRQNLSPLLARIHLDYPPAAFAAVQRNGSRNTILAQQGKRPDLPPLLQPPYDPAVTPPKPHQGAGTQPYFSPGSPGSGANNRALARLFAPIRGER
jgi:phospholipid/cholesterol/gamma-HCH transport system substrate-binding protein